jgi:hypothetical protein
VDSGLWGYRTLARCPRASASSQLHFAADENTAGRQGESAVAGERENGLEACCALYFGWGCLAGHGKVETPSAACATASASVAARFPPRFAAGDDWPKL